MFKYVSPTVISFDTNMRMLKIIALTLWPKTATEDRQNLGMPAICTTSTTTNGWLRVGWKGIYLKYFPKGKGNKSTFFYCRITILPFLNIFLPFGDEFLKFYLIYLVKDLKGLFFYVFFDFLTPPSPVGLSQHLGQHAVFSKRLLPAVHIDHKLVKKEKFILLHLYTAFSKVKTTSNRIPASG